MMLELLFVVPALLLVEWGDAAAEENPLRLISHHKAVVLIGTWEKRGVGTTSKSIQEVPTYLKKALHSDFEHN